MDQKRLETLEDKIAEALREAQASGELESARSYGKSIDFGDGYDETPPELRMAFKALKDSGFAPPEVALMQDQAALRRQLQEVAPDSEEADALRGKINQLEVEISLRIERLAKSGL